MSSSSIYRFSQGSEEFYPTQSWVSERLYSLMKPEHHVLLDPCAGAGGLEQPGYDYVLYDLIDHGIGAIQADFLTVKSLPKQVDAAVLNPPFSKTEEFVEHCFDFTPHVYIIAPTKTILTKFGSAIQSCLIDWRVSQAFNILTSVGLFYLKKPTFGVMKLKKDDAYKKFFVPKATETWADHFVQVDHAPDKPFIVNRMTKARIVRGEVLIQDADVYQAGDESAFVSKGGNQFREVGSSLARDVLVFDTLEEAKNWQALQNSLDATLREYCYQYGNNILRLVEIPWLS